MTEKGVGTKAVGYAGPKLGPFRCGRCQWFSARRGLCSHPEVVADPEVSKMMADGTKRAVVDAYGCCNEFNPGKG